MGVCDAWGSAGKVLGLSSGSAETVAECGRACGVKFTSVTHGDCRLTFFMAIEALLIMILSYSSLHDQISSEAP